MSTINCTKCTPEKSCGGYHLYVIEFRTEVEETYAAKSNMGYLYVGSTSKSVESRFEDNFIKKNGKWKYNTPNSKRIRAYFKKFRPDLFYNDINPLPKPKKNDKKMIERREGKLADKLRKIGYKVGGPSWKKMKSKSKKQKEKNS